MSLLLCCINWERYWKVDAIDEDILDSSDESLFRPIRCNPQHVLHQLLPPPKHIGYNLRSRRHGLTLSVIQSEFMHTNFINHMLFNDDIY